MKLRIIFALASATILYVVLVLVFGFAGPIAHTIQFGRVADAVAVQLIYLPALAYIFNEVPAPRRDYLLVGTILTWLSGLSFSVWNEMGRIFHVDTSIFTSPISGFFSLILVGGGIFLIIAPDTTGRRLKVIAVTIAITFGGLLVFVAPLFR